VKLALPTWRQKPPMGTPIDDGNPLAQVLVSMIALNDMGGASGTTMGLKSYDCVNGLRISGEGSPTYCVGSSAIFGTGIQANATGMGVTSASLPNAVYSRITYPCSAMVCFRWLGTNPSLNSNIWSLQTASSGGVEVMRLIWGGGNNTVYLYDLNIGIVSTGLTATANVDYVAVMTWGLATQTLWLINPLTDS